jgi:hypothetical protein
MWGSEGSKVKLRKVRAVTWSAMRGISVAPHGIHPTTKIERPMVL